MPRHGTYPLVKGKIKQSSKCIISSRANHPQFNANNAKLRSCVAQRLVTKRLAGRAVAHVERVVQPQAVVATARPHAQEARLAVNVEVVEAAVRERLEANPG